MRSFGDMAVMGSMITRPELNMVFSKRYRRRKDVPTGVDEPDYLCFLAYAVKVLELVYTKWPAATLVNFIVSNKKGVSHHFDTFTEEMRNSLKPPLRDLVGNLIPASMEFQKPLQAADCLMFHLQRYYAAGKSQAKMKVEDGMRLADLIHNGALDGTIYEWKLDELERMADKWEKAGIIPV